MRTPSLLAGNSLVTALPPTKFTRSTTSAFSGSAKKSSPTAQTLGKSNTVA
eukprot:CAMPEP_0195524916 /NCGR_PEP_ID=MMETSP0794_2-20130614/25037_1 /TAXON_ID=515487 /ORGANISM="Stephanopyxis turris, Strain CCMP 815" /LENGTH=50 /DNA_ID=CAMNT_0040655241 /DNA_START=125 /DNA_END=277 /DNA_ORIENTATION=+